MAKGLSFGAEFFSKTAASASSQETEPEAPLRILVLANFSGAGAESAAACRPISIDRDNFDDVFARIAPSLSLAGLPADGSTVELEFDELDQLHPDRLASLIDDFRRAGGQPVLSSSKESESSQRADITSSS